MKFVASDFDGTIYFSFIGDGKGFKDGDLKAIKKFREAGHQFGICTGRPLIGIESQCKRNIEFDFYILTNGALILDKDKNIVYEKTLSLETMKLIAEEYSKRTVVWVHAENGLYVKEVSKSVKFHQNIVKSFDEVPPNHIYGVSFELESIQEAYEVSEFIKENYPECDAFRNDRYIDVIAKGASKGNALKAYEEYTNAETSYGIGDNYNDITLLEGADVSYTFHTSPKEVKDVATYLVDSVEEAIEQILNTKGK